MSGVQAGAPWASGGPLEPHDTQAAAALSPAAVAYLPAGHATQVAEDVARAAEE